LAKVLYECTLCANCRQQCGAKDPDTGRPRIDVPAITKAMRADLFAAGVEVPEGVKKFGENIERTYNILGAPMEERAGWLSPDIEVTPDANVVYFPGCLTAYRAPEVAQATARILNKAGIQFSILGAEEYCCGDPLIMTGQLQLARGVARHNYELLKNKSIITTCAGCYRTFREEYPKLLGKEFRLRSRHMVGVLVELIGAGKIKFNGAIKGKVTYHDPCELGRELGVYDQPRQVIRSIPGIELVEMYRRRENAWCCGGGGGLKAVNPEMALEIAQDRVEEALATGAQWIVSACPSCKTNIRDAIQATGAELQVMDITELVAASLV